MYELTLSGPGKNALGSAMMATLQAQLREAAGRPVLLTGAGDAFCSGLDLKEVASLDPPAMDAFLRRLDDVVTALFTYPGPTVCAVNGHAIAGGAVLAMCCDWRVAGTNARARIGLNELALGVRFPPCTLAMVRARLPPATIDEVVLGAALHDPQTALRLRLVDELADDPAARAREVLTRLSAHPSDTYAATKSALRADAMAVAPEERDRALREIVPVWTSEAVRARILRVIGR